MPGFLSSLTHRQYNWETMPPLNGHRCFSSRSLSEINAHTSSAFSHGMIEIVLENEGAEVDFIHNRIAFSNLSLNFIDYRCAESAILIDAPAMSDCYVVQMTWSGQAKWMHDGALDCIEGDSMALLNPGVPVAFRLEPGYQGMLIHVDRTILGMTLADKLGRRPAQELLFDQRPVPMHGQGNALAAMVLSLCANADSAFPTITQGSLSRQVQDMLCSLIICSLPHNYTDEIAHGLGPAPYYVRRVESFIHAHAKESISFHDLVEVARVSSRTIHDGFRRFRHTTPMAYLKDHRLTLARTQLQNGPGERVTEIALDCGFNHLSKFSLEYQQRFGERPSETLNRRDRERA
jgi:AraC-like DNA-binding protein